jgi:hypothetical protein
MTDIPNPLRSPFKNDRDLKDTVTSVFAGKLKASRLAGNMKAETLSIVLAEKLKVEIARASAKRDHWRNELRAHPKRIPGMTESIRHIEADISYALKALGSGRFSEMLFAYRRLIDWGEIDQ